MVENKFYGYGYVFVNNFYLVFLMWLFIDLYGSV